MKVVDAVWEKRNLGVNTQEITILASDSIEEVEKTLKTLSAEYQVVKIPTGNTKVMWKLEDMGFRYIETIVHVENSLKNLELKGIPKRINDELTYELMNQKDRNQMFEEIRKGMFKTDRVALDSNFSLQQANNRYIGWISDEIEKGTEVFKYIYHNQTIGFFTFKEIARGVYYPFLAGIYKQYQNSPVGMIYLYKPLEEAKKRDAKFVSTYISMNNSNAVRLHVQFGFEFKNIINVYVKHC